MKKMAAVVALKRCLNTAKNKLQKSLVFHEAIEESMPESHHWSIKREPEMRHTVYDLLRYRSELPTDLLREVISTIDEYIASLDNMSADQVSAFFLGLGLSWINLPYFGRRNTEETLSKIDTALKFSTRLEKAIPSDDSWKVEKEELFIPLGTLVPRDRKLPTELLKEYRELLSEQLRALEEWSFS